MIEKKEEQSTSVKKEQEKSSKDDYSALAKQIQTEFELAWKHQKSKKDVWEVRLKLYNNQKRDKDKVGDTTLFTVHQTVLASLYDDRLMVTFNGREEGDEETAENLTAMAEYDYEEMSKAELDYEWDWDTAFFGRGLVVVEEYVREPDKGIYVPLPEVLDPITFLRDPLAKSVNGNPRTGKGSARFMGYEAKMSKDEMMDNDNIFDDVDYKSLSFGSGTLSVLSDAIAARDTAQGRDDQNRLGKEAGLKDNAKYDITVWYTHHKVGDDLKKVKVWLANERGKVIGMKVLKHDYWPIVDRSLYPTAHDWDGTSIPDLVEDKQRARAVAQNLALEAMKADLYPMYIYDTKKVMNRKDLKYAQNKFIPLDRLDGASVSNAVAPLIKARPNMNLLDFVYTSLDASAQKATATPEIQQGAVSEENRTLGELNLVASKVDTRYSLSAKVFGWSEKKFWQHWYQMYKDNFESDIDEKVVRLEGAFGPSWRPLQKKDVIPKIDPDISIESKVISRAKQLEERQSLTEFFSLAMGEPTANRRYAIKKLADLYGMEKDEVDRLLPPTIDERIAEQQNDDLNENKFVGVLVEDDHNVHLEIHSKANLTDATKAHIKTHEQALSIKKTNPDFFPAEPEQADFQQPGANQRPQPQGMGRPAPGRGQQNPRPIQPSQTSGIPTQA